MRVCLCLFRQTAPIYRPAISRFNQPFSRSPANSCNSTALGFGRTANSRTAACWGMETAVMTTTQQGVFRAAGRERGAIYTRPSEKRKPGIRIRKNQESAGRVSLFYATSRALSVLPFRAPLSLCCVLLVLPAKDTTHIDDLLAGLPGRRSSARAGASGRDSSRAC